MEKDSVLCKKRYEFLRLCAGGKGPVPWTREEDKQILSLVTQHGKFECCFRLCRINVRNGFPDHVYVAQNLNHAFLQGQKSGAQSHPILLEEVESSAVSAGIII
jgi:hypothetical protein